MTDQALYLLGGVCISALLTFALRAFPFTLMHFARRHQRLFCFLGKVMPPGMMVILAVYATMSLAWGSAKSAAVSAVALLTVIILEYRRRQPLLSIGVGLLIYVVGQSFLASLN